MKDTENTSKIQQKLAIDQQNFQLRVNYQVINLSVLWQKYAIDGKFPSKIAKELLHSLNDIATLSAGLGYSNINQLVNQVKNIILKIYSDDRRPTKEETKSLTEKIKDMRKPVSSLRDSFTFNTHELLQNSQKKELIYLIDEDVTSTLNLSKEIKSAGFNVVIFNDYENFRLKCNEKLPTIIIIEMESENSKKAGTRAINGLREKFTITIPVFFMSKNGDVLTRLSAANAGGSHFLTKPLSTRKIISSLLNIIKSEEQEKLRVLLIDDDNDILLFLKNILNSKKFDVKTLQDPLDLLSTLEKFSPEVLVLDNYMPKCSGFDLAKIIRQISDYSDLPIVFLSAEEKQFRKLEGMDIGADDFLTKPVEPNYFNRLIYARAVRTRQIRRIEHELKINAREASYLQIAMDQHSIVSATDAAGIITFANEKFCEISGYNMYELVGKNHSLINSGYHDAEFFDAMWKQITRGEAWHGEICNRNKNGELYWVKSSVIPFLDDQLLPYQYISVRTDITKIKASEAQAIKNELLVNQHHAAILELAQDETLAKKGIDASLQVIFNIMSEQMSAQRISVWNIDQKYLNFTCKFSYTTSDRYSFITEQLNATPYVKYLSLLKKQVIINAVEAQNSEELSELKKTYLIPCNIRSKIDVALFTEGRLSGVLFIESIENTIDWSTEHQNFAKTIAETISRRLLQHKSIHALEALEKSESRLRRSQKHANIGTWDWDIKTGKLYWSDQVAALFGYETRIPETTYNTFHSAIHPQDRNLVINAIKASTEGEADYNLEHRIVTQKGDTRWLATQGTVIRDENGQPSNMLCIVQDIHQRKILEKNIDQQQQLLNTIRIAITKFVESLQTKNVAKLLLPDLLTLTGSDYGFIATIDYDSGTPDLKMQAVSKIKWSDGEIKTYDINLIEGPVFSQIKDLISITTHHGIVVINNNPMCNDHLLNHAKREEVNVESYLGIPIIYGDITVGMFGLANRPQGYDEAVISFLQPFTLTYGVIIHAQKMANQDVKQRKAIIQARESAEKANQAKSKFLSNMSHELRTPLNAILGFTQLLSINDQKNPLDSGQRESIHEIGVAGEHLLALINDILDLSKIETGFIDLDVKQFSLDALFQECRSMVYTLAEKKNVQLKFETQNFELCTDRKRLMQILLNLLTNAIKYNKPNGNVDINAKMIDLETIRICIKDTGIGIAEENQRQLFKSFARLGAEKTNIQGTGIGLVIAKSMTEYLGGTLSYSSEVNIGTKFWIDIPITLRLDN